MARFDPSTKIFHGRKVPQIYSPQASIGQVLLFNFLKSPEKVIQVSDDDGVALTCAQLSDMMTKIARSLVRLGCSFGDVAGIVGANTTFAAPALFGCFLVGLTISPLDTSFNVDQIVQIYRVTKPKLVFCDRDLADKVISALELLESDARLIILTERIDGFLHISDLISEPEEPVEWSMELGNSSDVCAAVLCTSGSTGLPKMAMVSHAQLLHPFTLNQFHENSFSLNFSSMYWLTGFSNLIYLALNCQKRLITTRQFSPDVCFDLIAKYELSVMFLLPPHVILFVESPRFKTADLSSVKVFTTGGLFTSEQLRRTLQGRLPNGKVCIGYGMTEVGGIIAETDPNAAISSSVGKPTVNTEIKILIDDGTTGGLHDIGEVLVRKPMKFLGYCGTAHSTVQDHDGWIHTGDMGFISSEHEIHVVGQRTFMIKNFYVEIFPNEIEEVIRRIQGVHNVCVVGTPDTTQTEVPSAFVVKHPEIAVTEDDVRNATSHLDTFKRVRDVFFVESLPVAPSGKLQRRLVKEMAEEMKILRQGN